MRKEILKNSIKLVIFTSLFFVIILAGKSFFTSSIKNQELKSAEYANLGGIGVALSSNIGMRYTQRSTLPVNSYSDTLEIGASAGDEKIVHNQIISGNMLFVKDYYNLLRTKVPSLLDNSYNREETLDEFINQLSLRYKEGNQKLLTLNSQRVSLEGVMTRNDTNVENLKIKIGTDFSKFDTASTLENINEYILLKNDYTYARTYIIFVNKFISQYTFLNEYNKVLLDTLINNKDILVKDSFVVIPDSGDELLQKMNIIFDEQTYKASLGEQTGEDL
ncbi:hypothetical protein HGA92_01915 [Candidatus Gracilibacteria bacterium]|nr:hypothetical protein [Candidatus Gracilibacteria bacterium]NUJ99464.1 hypothetical protein [Candidatus Gracilibacteria bacterium]